MNKSSDAHAVRATSSPSDSLSVTRNILKDHGIYLGDLPRDPNDPIWVEMSRPPLNLSVPALDTLRSYILSLNIVDDSFGGEEFTRSPVGLLLNCLDDVPDVLLDDALITHERALVKAFSTTSPHAELLIRKLIDSFKTTKFSRPLE
jgi:hypothetical protein